MNVSDVHWRDGGWFRQTWVWNSIEGGELTKVRTTIGIDCSCSSREWVNHLGDVMVVVLSPKGLKGSFRVNNPNEVWYEDLMGSGTSSGQAVQTLSAQTLIMRLQASKPFLMFVKMEE